MRTSPRRENGFEVCLRTQGPQIQVSLRKRGKVDQVRDALQSLVSTFDPPSRDLDSVLKGGRRRRRLWRAQVAFSAIASGAVIVWAVAAWPWAAGLPSNRTPVEGSADPGVAESASDWEVYADPAGRFILRYPPGWTRAEQSLTPHLEDPQELFTVSTLNVLTPGGDRCANIMEKAIGSMSATDALVTVQEASGDNGGRPRPNRFQMSQGSEFADFEDCLGDETGLRNRWFSFRDGDRYFFALVVLGRDADQETESHALEVLDALSFP